MPLPSQRQNPHCEVLYEAVRQLQGKSGSGITFSCNSMYANSTFFPSSALRMAVIVTTTMQRR